MYSPKHRKKALLGHFHFLQEYASKYCFLTNCQVSTAKNNSKYEFSAKLSCTVFLQINDMALVNPTSYIIYPDFYNLYIAESVVSDMIPCNYLI